jgi:ABC-type polysaccharide/polyol phosphate transport system ATPase subunit
MSEPIVRMTNVGKAYKVFSSPFGILLDAVGLARFTRSREFWAVRGFDLELAPGERLGLIGRNGAGKSTVLKLITQNVDTSEGTVEVDGEVHALFEAGGGLHPEFSGYENIRAALETFGLDGAEIADAKRDIEDFTELGRFLDQPLKTYSLGMQSRLSFGISTVVRPEILIVDEILGAGDAYFFGKAVSRMQGLVESGAAVLIVSHALDQVVRFCEETIWLDRGRIVMRGPSTEVVKAYEQFIRNLEDRRLRAKNRKSLLAQYDAFERESYTDHVELELAAGAEEGSSMDVSHAALIRNGEVEDELVVGGAQDADETQSAFVTTGAGWSEPRRDGAAFFRRLGGGQGAAGRLAFALWFYYPQSSYEVEITYRSRGGAPSVALGRVGDLQAPIVLEPTCDWTTTRLRLARGTETDTPVSTAELSRWRGAAGLLVEHVRMLDEDDREQAVFEVHRPLSVVVDIVATEDGRFPLIPAALVFRLDGIVVTRHVGEEVPLELKARERVQARLDLGPLQLGDGSYLLSVGLYRRLDLDDTLSSEYYDYFDRSFEFAVTGNPPLHNEVFRHPGTWTVNQAAVREPSASG